MSTFLQDLRFTVRTLPKEPGFACIVVLTLALGIGANTAIFGIVNAVLLRPLPYRTRTASCCCGAIGPTGPKRGSRRRSWPTISSTRSLEHVAAFSATSFNLAAAGEPLRVRAAQVQASIFPALGVQPIAGRVFTAEEDAPGHEHVVLLAEGLWRSRFAADPAIIGRTIALDGTPYTVLGVLPAALRLPLDYASRAVTQLWVPLALGPVDPNQRGNHGLNALGRLRAGVSLAQAQAEMTR